MPMVKVPVAYLQSLHVPTMVIFTMSLPFPKSRNLSCGSPPPSERVGQERHLRKGKGLRDAEDCAHLCRDQVAFKGVSKF